MFITNARLREYADELEAAGFTIYEPISGPGSYFRYSRMVDGKECFGYVQADYLTGGFQHLMPIVPTVQHGSSMWVEGAGRKPYPANLTLTVQVARLVASPVNYNELVGKQVNFADPRFEHLYRKRTSTPERGDVS
ncbi:hypothetical protein SEA_SCHOOLBUS_104 [Mycobacterium phage SchoolBus]|nr:hypothetical protein SEA_SCHOOLBUS_104 [Mycobacterium phage SchoolBus]QOC58536.1 hypothetical protein SEA_SHIDA_107 [Mycobacterium phage Shida]